MNHCQHPLAYQHPLAPGTLIEIIEGTIYGYCVEDEWQAVHLSPGTIGVVIEHFKTLPFPFGDLCGCGWYKLLIKDQTLYVNPHFVKKIVGDAQNE